MVLGLHTERDALTPRLDARVEGMWHQGLVDEARSLVSQGLREGVTASKAIGYHQALAILDGEMSESEAIENTQALTRRYARRQVSWFRRDDSITWLGSEDECRVTDAASLVLSALA